MKNESHFEVIIVGGSYSGLAAAMALGSALRSVLIIDSGHPCNSNTPASHNFLTNDGKAPGEISFIAKQQVEKYGTVKLLEDRVTSAITTDIGFDIKTINGSGFSGRRLLFATGIKDILPEIPGFSNCWGISALHCPFCHGYEVHDQLTGILANGDTAIEMAALISNWTRDLTIFTNGDPSLTPQQIKSLRKHQINLCELEIREIEHVNGQIKNIHFKDGRIKPLTALYSRLPFVQHSSLPGELNCELLPSGYIKTDAAQKTTVPGIYACGDNSSKMRTLANAVSTGTTAGMMINKDLSEESF